MMMSPRLPRVTGKEVVAALKRTGFIVVRDKSGSHKFLSHPDDTTRYATVAVHSGKNIPVDTLGEILRTARLTQRNLEICFKPRSAPVIAPGFAFYGLLGEGKPFIPAAWLKPLSGQVQVLLIWA